MLGMSVGFLRVGGGFHRSMSSRLYVSCACGVCLIYCRHLSNIVFAFCVGSVRTRESSLAVYDRSYRNAMTSQLILPTFDRYVSFGTGLRLRTTLKYVRPGVVIG
jgi:hypothetical protein